MKKSYFSRLRPVYKILVNTPPTQPPPPPDVHDRAIGYGTVGLALAAFLVSCLAYLDLREQVKETRVQSKAAQDQATAALKAQRPWLFAADLKISDKATIFEGEWILPVSITLRNTGNEPALLAISSIAATVGEMDGNSIVPQQRDACDKREVKAGDAIFPGQDRVDNSAIFIDQKLIDRIANEPSAGHALVIVGCVRYRSPYDGRDHTTGLAYNVGVQIGGRPRTSTLPKDLSTVDPKDFRMNAWRGQDTFWAD